MLRVPIRLIAKDCSYFISLEKPKSRMLADAEATRADDAFGVQRVETSGSTRVSASTADLYVV